MHNHAEHALDQAAPSFFVMAPAISDRKVGCVSVIDVNGALTADHAAPMLRSRFHEWLDKGETEFAINLSGVEDIDSYGLGALAAAYNWVTEAGGHLAFYRATPRVRRTLGRLRLDSIFAMFDDEEGALRTISSGSCPASRP